MVHHNSEHKGSEHTMKLFFIRITNIIYKTILKPILFLIDPELVHKKITVFGSFVGRSIILKTVTSALYKYENPNLIQKLFGVTFYNPVGLAAGFDYEAKLTHILPELGFGFGTVGTITNGSYQGNPSPMLGRLPMSRSLMVNKGFKNWGIEKTLQILANKTFQYPVGLSIGKTNCVHKSQTEAVEDVVQGFEKAERSDVGFSYYELNISCPNLMGSIEFYDPDHLKNLLDNLSKLMLTKPVFVKMPISKSDDEILAMMNVITCYPWIKAVIVGNLQKDRNNPQLNKREVDKFSKGNFSGLPCKERSDELIALIYKQFGTQIKIVGCGGIFSAEDAYQKIKKGASLVQLITGLVFEGPQLASQINLGLSRLIKKDGYQSIGQAIGTET